MENDLDIAAIRLGRQTSLASKPRVAANKKGRSPIPRHLPGQHFLKGPVPLDWLAKAACCGTRALHVGIILWYRVGLEGSRSSSTKIPGYVAKNFGLDRHAKTRGLRALEKAGLVTVKRETGRSPVVTLLEAPECPDH